MPSQVTPDGFANNPGRSMSQARPTLLLTRPQDGSERFVASLDPELVERVQICISPLFEIVPTATALALEGARGLIFTSRNGVRIASELSKNRDLPAFCIGVATTEYARGLGWVAETVGQDAETLKDTLRKHTPPGPLVHIRGVHSRGNIAAELSAQGIQTQERIVYDQVACDLTAKAQAILTGPGTIIAPIFSPRMAQLFIAALPERPIDCVAISPAVAEVLAQHPTLRINVVKTPDAWSMREMMEKLLHSALSG